MKGYSTGSAYPGGKHPYRDAYTGARYGRRVSSTRQVSRRGVLVEQSGSPNGGGNGQSETPDADTSEPNGTPAPPGQVAQVELTPAVAQQLAKLIAPILLNEVVNGLRPIVEGMVSKQIVESRTLIRYFCETEGREWVDRYLSDRVRELPTVRRKKKGKR